MGTEIWMPERSFGSKLKTDFEYPATAQSALNRPQPATTLFSENLGADLRTPGGEAQTRETVAKSKSDAVQNEPNRLMPSDADPWYSLDNLLMPWRQLLEGKAKEPETPPETAKPVPEETPRPMPLFLMAIGGAVAVYLLTR